MSKINSIEVVVESLSRQGENNLAITLVSPSYSNLPIWKAGDHIDIFLPNNLIRQYSLTGTPLNKNEYIICIKKDKESKGGSKYIHENIRIGQKLKISFPRSAFPLVDGGKHILLAGGIGITPLLAMAEELENRASPFYLFYYVGKTEEIAFSKRWKHGFKHGEYHILKSSQGESIRNGLPDICKEINFNDHLYICGSNNFIEFCKNEAIEMGLRLNQIHYENFKPPKLIDDKNEIKLDRKNFIVILHSTGQKFLIPEDKSIAQVLMENQIFVPISCEVGMCGACLTRICQGEVDHQDTVQSESEKQADQQFIALCCSRAKGEFLEIDL